MSTDVNEKNPVKTRAAALGAGKYLSFRLGAGPELDKRTVNLAYEDVIKTMKTLKSVDEAAGIPAEVQLMTPEPPISYRGRSRVGQLPNSSAFNLNFTVPY